MIFVDRAPNFRPRRLSARAFRVFSGIVILLSAGISAKAVEPLHAPAPASKTAVPPVLSIGTITIAPPPAEAGKPLPAAAGHSTRTQPRRSHKLRPGDLMLPTYMLDRA